MPEGNDLELIKNYLKGDEQSLQILVQRYSRPIYSFVYRYVGNPDEAVDITQEVFVRAWRNLKRPLFNFPKRFNPKRGSFKNWIFAIARNASLDFLKKKKAISFSDLTTRDQNEEEKSFLENIADVSPPTEELFEQKEMEQKLRKAMEKLPPSYHAVILMRHNDHLNFREIAENLSEPLDTIKSRYRRGLIKLKKLIAEP